MANIQQGDIGTVFIIEFNDSETGSVLDVSTATTKQIVFKKPDATTVTKTAAFTTDGTDGKIQYTTEAGDMDAKGNWQLQGIIITPTFTNKSSIQYFKVDKTI